MRIRSSVLLGAGLGSALALVFLSVRASGVRRVFEEVPGLDVPLGGDVPAEPPAVEVPRESSPTPRLKVRSGPTSEGASGPELTASLRDVPLHGPAPREGSASPSRPSPTPTEPNPHRLEPELYLGALSRETVVYERPSAKSKMLGFVRTGAILRRANAPISTDGCKEGWYLVEPTGYVCVGRNATLDIEHPVLKVASYQPDRSQPLPYPYGRSRYPTPPLYTKIPSREEQQRLEPDLKQHLRAGTGDAWKEVAQGAPPRLLDGGARVPRPFGYPVLEEPAITGRALGNSAFSFVDLFEAEGRPFGITSDLSLLPLDRLTPVTISEFEGLVLGREDSLPVAFTRSEKQFVYREESEGGSMLLVRAAKYREGFRLSGKTRRIGGVTFFATRDGEFLKEDPRLVRIEAPETFPKWAKGETSWLDISLLRQTLVAYRGQRPVFATLVSTGRDGTQDPATTHSTVQGLFRIHTKHVTATMSGNSADDEFDLRDVPYVQYFHEGYALHAAFWHDGFGTPRSHGCINLAPRDARYLFSWTEPNVPMRWHSALSLRGTYVFVHP